MGEKITDHHFERRDFREFGVRLKEETALLAQWLGEGQFCSDGFVAGFELEAWLVDEDFRPAPVNDRFMKFVDSALVVPELAMFTVSVEAVRQDCLGCLMERRALFAKEGGSGQ
jgi:hypothetical protein